EVCLKSRGLVPGGWYTHRQFPFLQQGPIGSAGSACREPRGPAAHASNPGDFVPLGPSTLGVPPMSEVTRILSAIEQGDPSAAGQLLPLVYDELRRLAARQLAQEQAGQTLQATALVHEAYLRLVGDNADARWKGRGHFFAAAARAMRQILIDNA